MGTKEELKLAKNRRSLLTALLRPERLRREKKKKSIEMGIVLGTACHEVLSIYHQLNKKKCKYGMR